MPSVQDAHLKRDRIRALSSDSKVSSSSIDGILLSTGEHAYAGLHNSFLKKHDLRKRRYLTLALGILAVLEVSLYLGFTWRDSVSEIEFSAMSVDLGDFKPRARRTPLVEVDEVFGNQFVKEKKSDTPTVANEAGGSIDGEGVVDLDVEGAGGGAGAPNIARCAVRNFPNEAKAYVDDALVLVSLLVDKTGLVREAKPLYVSFKKNLPPELKERMKKLFLQAGRDSLKGRRCPVYYAGGVATGYRLEVPLSYELYN